MMSDLAWLIEIFTSLRGDVIVVVEGGCWAWSRKFTVMRPSDGGDGAGVSDSVERWALSFLVEILSSCSERA